METISSLKVSEHELYDVWKEVFIFPMYHVSQVSGPEDKGADELKELIESKAGERQSRTVAKNKQGGIIGTVEDAKRICDERGIAPELSSPGHGFCSIGWCEKDQKWYGWSHRAIYGFGIGDVVEEGDCTASSGWVEDYNTQNPQACRRLPIGFKAETLYQAKLMAIAFADSVS